MKFQLTREFAYLEQSKTADFIIHRSFHYFHVLSVICNARIFHDK